jgi:hypothetical protein
VALRTLQYCISAFGADTVRSMEKASEPPKLASARTIALASLAALLGAGALFVTLVLPAEYGIDPLGTGKLLGVAAIAQPPEQEAITFKTDDVGVAAPVREGALTHYATPFNVNTAVLSIGPNEFVEYKYHMSKDASLEFTWEASGPVEHDNHSEPDTYPDDPAISLDKRKVQKSNGTLVAPFNGLHGWYWRNMSDKPITVKVTAAGFYEYAVELRPNHFRKRHAIFPAADMAKAAGPKQEETP